MTSHHHILAPFIWLSLLQRAAARHRFTNFTPRQHVTLSTSVRHSCGNVGNRYNQRKTITVTTLQSCFLHHLNPNRPIQTRLQSTEIKTLLPPPNQFYTAEEIIKKSRFIGITTPCSTWEEAQSYLEQVRKDHPKSRHVCFGFVSGGSENCGGTERCSDDGEPTGTAGVPILGAIKGEGLSDTLCIVVRYFGGIKLGAGGLIRAYGSAARLVLSSSPTDIYIPKSTIRLSTRTANSGAVYAAAAKFGGVTSGETYNDRGELEVCVVCDKVDGERLKEEIVDATRGGVMFL